MPITGTATEMGPVDYLPAGTYEARVAWAEEKISKSGNDMLEVKLRVFGDGGQTCTVREFLLANNNAFKWKVDSFAVAIGLCERGGKYELDASKIIGLPLAVKLSVEENDQYGKQNRVQRFLPPAKPADIEQHGGEQANEVNPDDNCPF